MIALRHHLLASFGALVAACAMTAAPAALAKDAGHDHHGSAPARLALDHGHKWRTDDSLRGGMERIRALVARHLPAAHAGTLAPADYAAVAAKVENEVAGIVANCKLEPKADAMLHLVIADLGAGTDAMAGKAATVKPAQGLVQVTTAVNNYGRYFQHPGFKPIRLDH
jgi:hypothetical protein